MKRKGVWQCICNNTYVKMQYTTLFRKQVWQQYPNRKEGVAVLCFSLLSHSDGFSRALTRLLCLLKGRSHYEGLWLDTRQEGHSAYFRRKSDSATNCHTSFRNCHIQLPFANKYSKQAQRDGEFMRQKWRTYDLSDILRYVQL
jgi:hypothetical protein